MIKFVIIILINHSHIYYSRSFEEFFINIDLKPKARTYEIVFVHLTQLSIYFVFDEKKHFSVR